MTVKRKFSHKVMSIILCITLIMTYMPFSAINVGAANTPLIGGTNKKVVDTPTVNGYEDIFKLDSTQNAGGVWSDKSVFNDADDYFDATNEQEETDYKNNMITDPDNFLVSLSALASSKQVMGYSTAPTDTVFVLDMSSSMRSDTYNNVEPLAIATNNAIKRLNELNYNNRIAVVLYSGAEGQNDNTTLPTRILLPLDRYTTTDTQGNFINYQEIRGREYISVDGDVRNSENESNFGLENDRSTWSAGTFTQDAIYAATQIFLDSDKVITEEGNVQQGQERMPIMVLMTDGEPSVFSTDYAGVHDNDLSDGLEHLESRHKGSTTSTGPATEFMVQLTAAYSKYLIEQAYTEHDLLFYSLGLDGSNNFSTTILDPENNIPETGNYWTAYLNDSTYQNLRLENNTVTNFSITTPAGIRTPFVNAVKSTAATDTRPNGLNKYRYYIDEYFKAESGDDLTAAFDSIVDEILLQSKYYPTLIEEGTNINYGGYLSMVDTLGKYMTVKDMKNIQLGDSPFYGRNAAREMSAMNSTQGLNEIQTNLLEAASIRLGVTKEKALEVIMASKTNGNLYFNSNSDFNNAICWYGKYIDAVAGAEYIGPWDGNENGTHPSAADVMVESYYFYGAGEATDGSERVGDMRYIEVDVVTYLDSGETKVRIHIPASLIPIVTYNVTLRGETLDSPVTSITVDEATPIRLLYEVGLKDGINSLNVGELAADALNKDENSENYGKYEFYTNKWDYKDKDGNPIVIGGTPPQEVGNSYSYYEPSEENEYMYYQTDTVVCQKVGEEYVPYTGTARPSGDGYYGMRYIYEKPATGSTTQPIPVYYEFDTAHHAHLESRTEGGVTTWVIPRGSHVIGNGDDVAIYKLDAEGNVDDGGLTDTYKTSATYYTVHTFNEDTDTSEYDMQVALGNNGKLTVDALQGIRLQKEVPQNSGLSSEQTYEFTIKPVTGSLTGTFDLYKVDAIDNDGTGGAAADGTVTAQDDSLKVTLTGNQTLYITGLPKGDYTVTEAKSDTYVVSAIDGTATNENSKTVTVEDDKFTTTSFTNIAREKGNLIIEKEITHPFGTNYQIPNTNSFDMTVTLTLDGEPLAGKVYDATQSNNAEITKVTTDDDGKFTITLAHNSEIEIFGLPENTVAKVEENNIPTYFKASYWNDGEATTEAFGEVTISSTDTKDILVVNDYKPNSVNPNIDLTVNKTLTGRAGNVWETTDSFDFELQSWNGTGWDKIGKTKTIHGGMTNKTIDFTNEIKSESYSNIGRYYYRVVEIEPATGILGVSYDKALHGFVVIVTDTNMDGNLEIVVEKASTTSSDKVTVVDNNDDSYDVTANFANVYAVDATSIAIEVDKSVVDIEGNPLTTPAPAGFDFVIYKSDAEGNINIGDQLAENNQFDPTTTTGTTRITIDYDVEGTYYYAIKEVNDGKTGWEYSTATKYVKVVVEEKGEDEDAYLVATAYECELKENATELTVVEGDNGSATAVVEFVNTYNPKPTTLPLNFVNKVLSGRDLKNQEFSFKLTSAPITPSSAIQILNGNTPQTVNEIIGVNAVDGKVTFTDDLYFDKAGEYFYEITETAGDLTTGITYDNTTERIVVTVADNNGELSASYRAISSVGNTITFHNTYVAEGTQLALEGKKTLEGRQALPLREGEFTFELAEADENGTIPDGAEKWIAVNDADGNFKFEAIPYDSVGEYYYVITEQNAGQKINGIAYSSDKYLVKVAVTDNLAGKLVANSELSIFDAQQNKFVSITGDISFTNTYEAEDTAITINGHKFLIGNRPLDEGDFTFELTEANADGTIPDGADKWTAENEANGTFTFEIKDIDKAGSYYFVLKEQIPTSAEKIKGVTYDTAWYRVKVDVIDNLSGQLVASTPEITRLAEVDGEPSTAMSVVFYNWYQAEPTTLTIGGKKELTGRTLFENEFTFLLNVANEQFEIIEGVDALKASNGADGAFSFEELTFEEVGTYYYVISEDATQALERVEYSKAKYLVTVTVTDDTDNAVLVADYTIKAAPDATETLTEADVVFTNKYTPKPEDITVDIDVNKLVENKGSESITPEGFEFMLQNTETEEKSTVKSDKDGKAKFTLNFTEEDIGKTYSYKLTEVDTALANVKYSTAVYNIEIAVSLNESNEIVADLRVNEKEVEAITAEFVNEYDYTPPKEKPVITPPEKEPVVQPEEPKKETTSPKTGHKNYTGLMVALLFVSGGVFSYGVFGKKKKEEAE